MDRHERKTVIDRPAIAAELDALTGEDMARAVLLEREWHALKATLDAIHEADDAG